MKKILFTLVGLFLIAGLRAQAVFELQVLTQCWNIAADQDSTIYAYWLMSSRDPEPRLISYLNANGQAVNVNTGSVSANPCCCNGNGGGGGSTVIITNPSDGVYNFNVDGSITVVHTRTDSIYTDGPLVIGGNTFNTNTDLQTILEAIVSNINTMVVAPASLGDTIYQVGHKFSTGTLLSQVAGNGDYFPASTASADSLPVAMVVEVLHPDTFVIDGEGWIRTGLTTLPPGRDYFLQANGTTDTIPDTTYNVFAYRTSSVVPGKIYFDIPEIITSGTGSGGSGGGGTATEIIASNGLNDQDATGNVDVELGGTLERNTTVLNAGNSLAFANIQGNNVARVDMSANAQTLNLAVRDIGTDEADISMTSDQVTIEVNNAAATDVAQINASVNSVSMTYTKSGSPVATIAINQDGLRITGVPNYADDAAADADTGLPVGGIYKVTGDRSLRIKP